MAGIFLLPSGEQIVFTDEMTRVINIIVNRLTQPSKPSKPSKPGLVVVQSPLGGGKTTLVEALEWIMYDSYPRFSVLNVLNEIGFQYVQGCNLIIIDDADRWLIRDDKQSKLLQGLPGMLVPGQVAVLLVSNINSIRDVLGAARGVTIDDVRLGGLSGDEVGLYLQIFGLGHLQPLLWEAVRGHPLGLSLGARILQSLDLNAPNIQQLLLGSLLPLLEEMLWVNAGIQPQDKANYSGVLRALTPVRFLSLTTIQDQMDRFIPGFGPANSLGYLQVAKQLAQIGITEFESGKYIVPEAFRHIVLQYLFFCEPSGLGAMLEFLIDRAYAYAQYFDQERNTNERQLWNDLAVAYQNDLEQFHRAQGR